MTLGPSLAHKSWWASSSKHPAPPRQAADDDKLVSKLLGAGMNCARVNTAHDSADVWQRIIATVQRCAEAAGKECRIFMDVAGPKLRTGALRPGPRVASFGPRRDVRGRDVAPAKVRSRLSLCSKKGTKSGSWQNASCGS